MPRRPRPTAGGAVPARLFVDSGAWIALVSARDQHHAEADAMFRAVATRRIGLLTTNLVLAETHRLLLHRAGIRPALSALDRTPADVERVFLTGGAADAVRHILPEYARAEIHSLDNGSLRGIARLFDTR